VFSFTARNHLTLKLQTSKSLLHLPSSQVNHLPHTQYVWLDFLVAACSILSMLLTFKYIYEVASLYNDLRI
jgi:hypothetical protein